MEIWRYSGEWVRALSYAADSPPSRAYCRSAGHRCMGPWAQVRWERLADGQGQPEKGRGGGAVGSEAL